MTASLDVGLPPMAVHAVAGEVRAHGQDSVETGGFFLTPIDQDVVTVVAFAGDRGISRRRDLFQISELALDRIFTYADDRDLHMPVQFHSHRLADRLSRADADHGLRVEGFVSTVIPTYQEPPCDTGRWGWWRFASGRWTAIRGPWTAVGTVEVVRFDEDGVRGG